MVINKIDRDYLDLNRDKTANGGTAAFEDPDAEAYYDYYHNTIAAFVAEILANHDRGLLIDVHGQGAFANTIFRGTQNGDTVTDLLNAFGEPALRGPSSIFGQLETLGYDVDPENNEPLNTNPETTYVGGYTVQTYGSDNVGGIDSIQIEFGSALRFDPNANAWQQSGADLAIALASHYNSFIVPEPASAASLLALLTIPLLRRSRG